ATIYRDLPEVRGKGSGNRDDEMLKHIERHLGSRLLAELSRQDLFDYVEKRRGETVFRCGHWTKIPVKDGTIRIELACLRHLRNLAIRYQDDFAKQGVQYSVSAVSFGGTMPAEGHRERVLADSERTRLLKECPVWLRRLLICALEACLS